MPLPREKVADERRTKGSSIAFLYFHICCNLVDQSVSGSSEKRCPGKAWSWEGVIIMAFICILWELFFFFFFFIYFFLFFIFMKANCGNYLMQQQRSDNEKEEGKM
jgi:hypothetical protein